MGVGSNVLLTCKRKEARGKMKKLRKMQNVAFASRKKIEDVVAAKFMKGSSENNLEKKPKKRKKRRQTAESVSSGAEVDKSSRKSKKQDCRKLELIRALREDEVEIKKLAKKLGYNKRKSKNLPQVFAAEGLDYILEMCDFKKHHLELSETDEEENLKNKTLFIPDNGSFSDNEIEEKIEVESFGEIDEEHMEEEEGGDVEVEEDIYGRTIDKRTGAIIPSNSSAREKLEMLVEKSNIASTADRVKLERSIRGIINRLNEKTIVSSVKVMKELFSTHSHNDVKQLLYESLHNAVTVEYRLPDRILLELALFIALLHSIVSADLSSHFVERFVLDYLKSMESPPENKLLENMSTLLAELYNFKVIKDFIVSDLVHRLVRIASDKNLECAKLLISYSGVLFRKRNFDALEKCISNVQSTLFTLQDESLKHLHLRFITEDFLDIKNGNIRKWTDAIDFSLFEHYMNLYRGLTKSVNREDELAMSIDDIEHVNERGRWWLVGSAWTPSVIEVAQTAQKGLFAVEESKFDQSLLNLAKKTKMNTSVRRNVFCTLMCSKNESDAFEKLMKLSLKGQQERELMHICVHCCLQESSYNPFYSAVIDQFCLFHKRFKLTVQYALWDRIKVLSSFKKWQQSHLSTLTAELIQRRSISLTVLKIIEFATIDAITTQYLRRTLRKILLHCDNNTLRDIFERIVTSSEQKTFSQGLQVFIHMAMKKTANNVLLERIDFLDSIWGDDRL